MGHSAGWVDRWPRRGWRTTYTPLGGLARAVQNSEAYRDLSETQWGLFQRATSRACLAINRDPVELEPDLDFFLAVATKVLQRGHNPVIGVLQDTLPDGVGPDELLRAAIGPTDSPTGDLDRSIDLHPTYERPFWVRAQAIPALTRFLVPQAPLEALIGDAADDGRRWVDFVLMAPWMERSVVIELDGQQHLQSAAVDAERDGSLQRAGFRVARFCGADVHNPGSSLWRALRAESARAPVGQPSAELLTAVHLPAAVTRMGVAIVELLRAGALSPGGIWDLDVVDGYGWGRTALPIALDHLLALGLVWGLDVAPVTVRTGSQMWVRDSGGYQPAPSDSVTRQADAVVHLEPFVPAHAALPASGVPSVVVRDAPMFGSSAWLPSAQVAARDVDADGAGVAQGLRSTLNLLFGFDEFRQGQEEAIRLALAGRDACVLLPTGAGKSLIYQVAGLLRPGVTLVIDPLVSLVEDQVRRLVDDGVDRVTGLTGSNANSSLKRETAYSTVADGDSLIAFLTPERLQTQAFRDALEHAAETRTVNLVVIDEAHCVSEWGHDFRTAYLRVGRTIRRCSRGMDDRDPPLLALSGTASPAVLRDVLLELEDENRPMTLVRPGTFDRPNLSYEILPGLQSDWAARMRRALTETIPTSLGLDPADLTCSNGPDTRSGIVFVPHVSGKFGLEAVQKLVLRTLRPLVPQGRQLRVGTYSGRPPSDWSGGRQAWDEHKVRHAKDFKSNKSAILVSTKAFGMGIDKPNIRWTLHVGHPSSLEGFAQESGRAGRDGEPAHCVLVASPPSPEQADALLDIRRPREKRAEAFRGLGKDEESDLTRQYFFLTNNYTGIEQELADSVSLLDMMLPAGPGNRVELPRTHGFDSEGSDPFEKALYRLVLIGIVDDYTIDYGAKKFVVDLDLFGVEHIDDKLLAFVRRVEPGRTQLRRREIADAPADLRDRAAHHLRLLLQILYDVIEPARVRALAEMHLFATSGESGEQLRSRILAYLSDGPLAGILNELANREIVDVGEVTRLLDNVPAEDPREWIGAAARQLETFPDHPVLLLTRALGEAFLAQPDEEVVATGTMSAFQKLDAYEVPWEDRADLFVWACAQLRNQQAGRGWALIHFLYKAWDAAGGDEDTVVEMEEHVLEMAALGQSNPEELRFVLARRLTRIAGSTVEMSHNLTRRAS